MAEGLSNPTAGCELPVDLRGRSGRRKEGKARDGYKDKSEGERGGGERKKLIKNEWFASGRNTRRKSRSDKKEKILRRREVF